jgi:hypothetical protein
MINIQVLCPWCSEDLACWYLGELESNLPSIKETDRCSTCKNFYVVKSMTIPEITVERGRSVEQDRLDHLEHKAKWKDKVVALRRKYASKTPASVKCRVFGHNWEILATSGYCETGRLTKEKCFTICKNCLTTLDTLSEEPDDHGYWCK